MEWLEREALTSRELAKQVEKLGDKWVGLKELNLREADAYSLIAQRLRNTESF